MGIRYLPALDGLRALAVLAVVCCHALPFSARGFFGVDVFFVLSGYLITRLLLETRPTLGSFYLRRFWRLTPPLYLMLAAYLLVIAPLHQDLPNTRNAVIAGLYGADYWNALVGRTPFIAHTWSLAVEEHFYLLWPLVLFRLRPSMKALLWVYVLGTIWRCIQPGWGFWYFRFDTHLTGLVLGCLIAGMNRNRWAAWPFLLVLAALMAIPAETQAAQVFCITAAELATAGVILGRAPRWLECDTLTMLGKLSYGIYLWHYPIAKQAQVMGAGWPTTLAVTALGSVLLATASYWTVEAMVRRYKRLPRRGQGLRELGNVNVQ